jgi:hypothetical protein
MGGNREAKAAAREVDLDRLRGLEQLISDADVEQALIEAGCVPTRKCQLNHSVMMWIVLAMGVFTDVPLRAVFRACRRFQRTERLPTRSALCRGRQRLGSRAARRLFQRVARPLCRPDVPGGFYRGLRLMGVDGSTYTVPDTPENERAFGRPCGGSSSTSVGGFPQVGKVSLVELGSHAEVAFAMRSLSRGEPTLAPRLWKHLTPGMLVCLDAGFYGYPLLRLLRDTGAHFLVRVSATPELKPIQELSDGSYLTRIHARTRGRRPTGEGMLVRVIRYTLDDPQRTGHGQEHRLVTSLLDEREYPARELVVLYHERWEHELVFDEQKTHQDPRRATKPTHLRSQTPAGVVQELTGVALAHYAVRKAMFDAAAAVNVDPDRLSFSGAFQILRVRLPECPAHDPSGIADWYQNLQAELLTERVEPRRNRVNPRVVKRARCKWPTKKPRHYRQPPLAKTFDETIVFS